MKLVKIEDARINPDAIDEIEGNDEETFIMLRSNNPINVKWPIEKVLQAISGSQEHKDKNTEIKTINAKNITSGRLS